MVRHEGGEVARGCRRVRPPGTRRSGGASEAPGRRRRITIFIGESDRYHHKPLYAEIVHRAHQRGLAGASVFRGIEGFGAASRIHTSRLLSLSEDLPLAIIIVDTAERTEAFLDEVADLVTGGLIMVDDVHVHTYSGGEHSWWRHSWRRHSVIVLAVLAGGMIGAPARYLADRMIQARHDSVFPWGTFAVNIGGSAVLGFLLGAQRISGLPPPCSRCLGPASAAG